MKTFWAVDKCERNTELCFYCRIPKRENAKISLVAKDVYNLFVNGRFVCYGPSRAAKRYARVDEIDLTPFLTETDNLLQVYVQSCRTATICFPCEKPLFGAEIRADGELIKTGADFFVYEMTDKVRRVERMSSHRGYLEIYRGDMRKTADVEGFLKLEKTEVPAPKLLKRNVRFAKNEKVLAAFYEKGGVTVDETRVWENDFMRLFKSEEKICSYNHAQCEEILSKQLCSFTFDKTAGNAPYAYQTYAFDKVRCGKFFLKFHLQKPTNIYLIYDDLLIDGYVKYNREQILHGLKWTLDKGEYALYSGEVYTAKYIALVADEDVAFEEVGIVQIENPSTDRFSFFCEDKALETIVDASKNSFAHNCYDIPTDCPTRERAGWLCDSYFTSIAEKFFTGENLVEGNFLENYVLFKNEKFLHDGVLPMCYPSEPKSPNNYIPNWILWFIVELEDRLKRTGDENAVKKALPAVRRILRFFEGYENEWGLLENLDGWVFIEWSKANEFTNGVNFPSNMLYAGALESAANLLSDSKLLKKAQALKNKIVELSYDGTFFADNAVRENGTLKRTENISETCQNYAAFFRLVDRGADSEFYDRLIGKFGCFRKDGAYPNVHKSNMFIGYILRLTVLLREGENELLLRECKKAFLPMAETTGTIWELFQNNASCNHGFGSIVASFIVYATFGIKAIDTAKKTVTFGRFEKINATAVLPLGEETAKLEIKDGERDIQFPDAYSVRLDG
ncbi:MAG: hypothetical protein IJB97_05470 [Clostridia bacterium]|nr:hypothetical protein [Clostridia bacterium]